MELDMVHQMIVPTKLGITVLKAALEILSFNMRQTVAIQLARRTKLLATILILASIQFGQSLLGYTLVLPFFRCRCC
jgi:hypothetical protein